MVNSVAQAFATDLHSDGRKSLGVIWSGDQAIPGARETIEYLERAGTSLSTFLIMKSTFR